MSIKGPWDGEWEVTKEYFGGGGQGSTHLVKRKTSPYEAGVLKVLRNNKSDQQRQRMYREVASYKTMHAAHGKVPRVLDHNTERFEHTNVQLYLVTEFIEGRTLEQLVKDADGLLLDEALRIVLNVCGTIKLGHDIDVLHRDIKPANLIVDESNVVFVVDYGLSFNADEDDDLTSMGEPFGNRFLALPETNIPRGNHRDPRSDITALCAIVCFCITNTRPGQLRDADNLPPHRRVGYSIREKLTNDNRASQLESMLDRAFATSLSSRFQSIDELIAQLESLAATSPEAPSDLVELARRGTDMLAVQDRKVLISEFVGTCDNLGKALMDHVARTAKKLDTTSYVVTPSKSSRPKKLEAVYEPLGVNGVQVEIKVKHHAMLWASYYIFAIHKDRCSVLRRRVIHNVPETDNSTSELQEIISFERNEIPTAQAVTQDIDSEIGLAMDFLTKKVLGRGIVE